MHPILRAARNSNATSYRTWLPAPFDVEYPCNDVMAIVVNTAGPFMNITGHQQGVKMHIHSDQDQA